MLYSYLASMNYEVKSMKSRLAERGQITIPQPLRKKLGLKPGTVLDFYIENKKLVAVKAETIDNVSKVYGCLKKTKKNTDELLKELRGI